MIVLPDIKAGALLFGQNKKKRTEKDIGNSAVVATVKINISFLIKVSSRVRCFNSQVHKDNDKRIILDQTSIFESSHRADTIKNVCLSWKKGLVRHCRRSESTSGGTSVGEMIDTS